MVWELLLCQFKHQAHSSTEQAFGAQHVVEDLGERGSGTKTDVDREGMEPGRKDARQASAQETRSFGLLGPGRAGTSSSWRSWERVQSQPGVAGRWHWSWWDPGAPCAMLTRRLINLRFFICFWELTSFEWVAICWLSEMARRQVNQKGKRGIRRTWKTYVAEEVNTVSIC